MLLPVLSFPQVKTTGTPKIINYPKAVYEAGTQNWGICQDQNGFMYFANNDGVLSFDGSHWNLIEVSQWSPIRSVFVDSKNSLYVGLINDFGVIVNESSKAPVFKSLKYLLPDDIKNFDDVWRIYEINNAIIFQSFKYLFIYKDDTIEVIEPKASFYYSFKVGDRLFIQEHNIGIFEYVDDKLIELDYWEEHKEKDISAILETEDGSLLICTASNGIYKLQNGKVEKWDAPINDFIKQNSLYSAVSIPGNYFAFGTIINGLVISDSKGNIVQSLSIRNGLQNNTILSMFIDRAGELWLGLDNGIDYLGINSPLSYISSDDIGTGYCCKVFDNKLYLGTNQGLYVRPFKSSEPFELIKTLAGQVWSIEEYDGQLICGHNLGTFAINGKTARKIGKEEGAWRYIQIKDKPELLLGGHYNGLVLLNKSAGGWNFYKKLEGFNLSSRYLYQDEDGDIWIGHAGEGIFRLRLSQTKDSITNISHYTTEYGLPSNTGNILFKYKKNIYVSDNRGIYEFNKTSNSFVFNDEMNRLFKTSGRINAMATDDEGDSWFIAADESGVIRQNEDFSVTKITLPFKTLKDSYVKEFEYIYPYNNANVFIGIENGFAHYSTNIQKEYNQQFQSYITTVELPYIDSTLYNYSVNTTIEFEFPFPKNSFRFHFAAPFFENEIPMQFSYFLEGFSEEWSAWSTDTYKDFNTLYEGDYLLKLKAKNIYDVESELSYFKFAISPPLHRSKLAYIIYVLIILSLTFLIAYLIVRRNKRLKLKEKIRHQEEIKQKEEHFKYEAVIAEKEIIKLRNDKLRTEMVYRDKELANQTMGIIQKNKFLIRINDDLKGVQDFIQNEKAKEKVSGIKRRIAKEIDIKQQNKIFETYFDEVHDEFFKRLSDKFPNLTPGDLRLCAFMRMNLTTQEIATILNISYRGAEISRYRLRKKLELSRGDSLSTFLVNI